MRRKKGARADARSEVLARLAAAMPDAITRRPAAGEDIESRPLIASAGLFWVNDQYLFKWIQDGVETSKFVSPAAVRAAFAREPVDSGWLAPNTVRCGVAAGWAWEMMFVPPGVINLPFENADVLAPAAGVTRRRTVWLRVPLPGLLFVGAGREYALFATPAVSFDPQMPLALAPLPNVHPGGAVCFGANTPPEAGGGAILRAWRLFCEAPFSSHLVNGKSRRHADDVRRALAELSAAGAAGYPADDLIPDRHCPTPERVREMIAQWGGAR